MRFIWGIIGIAIGVLIMKYSFWITNTFGRVEWAERYLASGFGGTYFLYKIIGVIVVVLAALYMFGFLETLLSPLTNIFGGLGEK